MNKSGNIQAEHLVISMFGTPHLLNADGSYARGPEEGGFAPYLYQDKSYRQIGNETLAKRLSDGWKILSTHTLSKENAIVHVLVKGNNE